MENQNANASQQSSGKGKMWLILLLLSLVLNIYQWRNHTTVVEGYEVKTDSLITARVDVEKELSATYEELNKYKGINGHLDSLLAEANTKIDEQKSKIAKLMRSEKNSAEYLDKID
jgi:ABC-type anion transport system duplicated permease subunit